MLSAANLKLLNVNMKKMWSDLCQQSGCQTFMQKLDHS